MTSEISALAPPIGPESPFKEEQSALCSVKTDIVSEASSSSSPTTPSASTNKMFHSYLNQAWGMNKSHHPSEPATADGSDGSRSSDNTSFFTKDETSSESLYHDAYDFDTPFPLQNELDSLLSLEPKPDKTSRPASLTSVPSPWPTDRPSSGLAWKSPSIWTDHPLVSPMVSNLSPADQKRVDEQQRALESAFFSRRSMSFSAAAGSRQGPVFQKQLRYRSNLPMMQEDYFGRLPAEESLPSSTPYTSTLAGAAAAQVPEDDRNVAYSPAASIWSPPVAQRTVSPDSAQWASCSPVTLRGAYTTQQQQQQQQQRRFSLTENLPCSDYWTSLVMDGPTLQRLFFKKRKSLILCD